VYFDNQEYIGHIGYLIGMIDDEYTSSIILFSSCSVWAWRKPGINSWLRAEPTLAENPKKRSKRGQKNTPKTPKSHA